MKELLLLTSTSEAYTGEADQSNGTVEKLIEVFKNPVFYIVIGILVILVIATYLFKRFTRAKPGCVVVIVRKGKIKKIINENDGRYYRVPFTDIVGAIISLAGNTFTSEKLFINDSPDRLYKINYTLAYNVISPEQYYLHLEGAQEAIEARINDNLRLFADSGNATMLIKDYRSYERNILNVINESIKDLGLNATSFKVNYVEPLGK